MNAQNETVTAELEWQGDVPIATRFNDPYFSYENGLAETAHVFLAGNDLPQRFTPGFHIAELGFGTGLNFLAALGAFMAHCPTGKLLFTSFEAYPMPAEARWRALLPFKDQLMIDVFEPDRGSASLCSSLMGERFELRVILGDARETLPLWEEAADAWFLDGFSPAKNPALWEAGLLREVARHTAAGGSFATYTAAGFVRRALGDAGFFVERVQGFGRKRHMTRGRLMAARRGEGAPL